MTSKRKHKAIKEPRPRQIIHRFRAPNSQAEKQLEDAQLENDVLKAKVYFDSLKE